MHILVINETEGLIATYNFSDYSADEIYVKLEGIEHQLFVVEDGRQWKIPKSALHGAAKVASIKGNLSLWKAFQLSTRATMQGFFLMQNTEEEKNEKVEITQREAAVKWLKANWYDELLVDPTPSDLEKIAGWAVDNGLVELINGKYYDK